MPLTPLTHPLIITGQSSQHIDFLFAGNVLGATSDIFDGSLRSDETRSLAHLRGDYYIAPKFLEAVGVSPSQTF